MNTPTGRDEKLDLLRSLLRPIQKSTSLRSTNGSGATLIGFYSDPILSPMFFGLYGLVFFFLPILPIKVFLLSNPRDDGGIVRSTTIYNIHGLISLMGFGRLYGVGGLAKLVLNSYFRFVLAITGMALALLLIAYGIPAIGLFIKQIYGGH